MLQSLKTLCFKALNTLFRHAEHFVLRRETLCLNTILYLNGMLQIALSATICNRYLQHYKSLVFSDVA